MPELPEVEAVCRKLAAQATGLRIVSARVFRCATPSVAELTPNRRIQSVERRGKHILIRLSGNITLHTHLRMSGNLFVIPDYRFHSARARVVFELSGSAGLVLEDSRALARMHALPSAEIDAHLDRELGCEPLSAAFTPEHFRELASNSRLPAKLFLMDQRHVAGLGNIYAAEALFRARVNPTRPINRLSRLKLSRLHSAIVAVLESAVQSAVVAYAGPGAFHTEEAVAIAVYGREGEPCGVCRKRIQRIAQGGRSTYFCPGCQR